MNELLFNVDYPVYNTRSEVLKAAHENACFYVGFSENPFKDSLINSWKFYKN